MTIIGFQFTKITTEKLEAAKGKVSINRKVNPTNAEIASLGTGQKALRYTFTFDAEYTPKIAEMHFEGFIVELVGSEKEQKEILKTWEETKRLPHKTMEKVMNTIIHRSHIQALLMAKEINIPPPFHMPKVRISEPTQEVEAEAAEPKKK